MCERFHTKSLTHEFFYKIRIKIENKLKVGSSLLKTVSKVVTINTTIVGFWVRKCLNLYTMYKALCRRFDLVTLNHLQGEKLAGWNSYSNLKGIRE